MDILLRHLRFLDAGHDPNLAFVGNYNFFIVALSIIVMCIAAYSALRIVPTINAATSSLHKSLWLATGAITMGIGVWAMHFVGMLALDLPLPVSYDLDFTIVSMLPAILAAGVMLHVISQDEIGLRRLILGGTYMGLGIGIMHYVGMAAMRTDAIMLYDLPMFITSVVVAVVLAIIALYTKFFISRHQAVSSRWSQIGAALIMGLAVVGMHYTGMAAVHFFPPEIFDVTYHLHTLLTARPVIDPTWLAVWITLISIIIISVTTFITMLDHRLELARTYGEQLEVVVAGRTEELQSTNAKLQVELEQRRQVQEALRLAKEAAEAEGEAKAEFLANMSHEIRTPLNAIVGMTELLMDTRLVDEQREFTETIRTSSDSLLGVINDILDFSKIEAHKMDLEAQPFDLRQCAEEALDMMVLLAAEKKLELAYLAERHVPVTIRGDITRVRQILLNLLNNAIKFTEKGEVVIMVESTPLPTPPAFARRSDAQAEAGTEADAAGKTAGEWCELHFSVRDTGIGIPPERMDRLFQPFSQIDASTTRKYGGTGLGLIISQRLSELMGGRMWVESKGTGHGTTFHFTLQVEIVPQRVPLALDAGGSLPKGKRGLIVDDNEINLRIVTHQLETWGMQSHTAVSSSDALRLVQAGESYDFAILDLYMPGMDGFELARQLRQLPNTAKMPLIMLTSHGDKSIHAEAEQLGFAAVLAKPVKQAQLNKVLHHVLGQTMPTPIAKAQLSSFDPSTAERMPLRILLAEDNVVNQRVAQLTLARLGYKKIEIVNNGLEALEELRRHQYDVVLMDVQMPELDGLETTRKILEEWPAEERPYIIAMTAHALTGDEERCLAAGMNGYVSKPIQVEKLVAALKQSQRSAEMQEEIQEEVQKEIVEADIVKAVLGQEDFVEHI